MGEGVCRCGGGGRGGGAAAQGTTRAEERKSQPEADAAPQPTQPAADRRRPPQLADVAASPHRIRSTQCTLLPMSPGREGGPREGGLPDMRRPPPLARHPISLRTPCSAALDMSLAPPRHWYGVALVLGSPYTAALLVRARVCCGHAFNSRRAHPFPCLLS